MFCLYSAVRIFVKKICLWFYHSFMNINTKLVYLNLTSYRNIVYEIHSEKEGTQWDKTQKKIFNCKYVFGWFQRFLKFFLHSGSPWLWKTLHSNFFQKLLILIFEANSALSCQLDFFPSMYKVCTTSSIKTID